MKKFFQFLGICSILVFSFYYTDKIALLVQEKNPVLQKIKGEKDSLEIRSEDATIKDETIIPGKSGSKVNVEKSFYNMKSLNSYNEAYLIYDVIIPSISLDNNKDKIIISGNKSNNQISIILEYNKDLISLFKDYKVDLLINKNTYNSNNKYELINNEVDKNLFNQVNNILGNDKINKHICIYNEKTKELCINNNNYLVKPTHKLNNSNIIEVKNSIENGSIILISKYAKLTDIKLLLKQIAFQDLDIVYLSDLIKE